MKKSLNQIRVELEEIATAHDQINTFFWGDPLRAWEEIEPEYPMMNCFVPDSSMLYNETEIQFTIVISDKHYKDWNENLNDVESDTLQIIRDVYQVINKSTRWQKFGTVESASASKFINDTGDEVAGWSMTVNFRLRDNSGVCGLPMTDYDFDQEISEGCADAEYTVEYENGTEIESGTIPSGESKLIIVPNPSACDPATITLEGSPFLSVASGDTENITIVDQNGNTPTINGTTGSEIEIQAYPEQGGALILKTGQITSYRTADDGDIEQGREVDFSTTSINNPFGNDKRHTGTTGGYEESGTFYDKDGVSTTAALAFPDDIVLDWTTWNTQTGKVLGYYFGDTTSRNWNDFVDWGAALSVGTFTTNWYAANVTEILYLFRWTSGLTRALDYAPFNSSGVLALNTGSYRYFWASTTWPTSTTNAPRVDTAIWAPSSVTKTTTANCIATRLFTVSGTTLT